MQEQGGQTAKGEKLRTLRLFVEGKSYKVGGWNERRPVARGFGRGPVMNDADFDVLP